MSYAYRETDRVDIDGGERLAKERGRRLSSTLRSLGDRLGAFEAPRRARPVSSARNEAVEARVREALYGRRSTGRS